MSYQALVCKAQNVREHPNADRLRLMTVNGYQVVVGLDVQEGDLGVLFVTDGRLSQAMAEANDLIRRKNEVTGKSEGGMFDANCRVRSQKLRGERSDGFWTPVSSLAWTGADLSQLSEGDQFSELNGHVICEKYYTPATLKAMKGGTPKTRKVNPYFHEHVDTKQLRYEIDRIPEDSIIYMTLKMHGTSERIGRVLDEVERPQGVFRKLLRRPVRVDSEYKVLVGTRRVVLKDSSASGFYGEDEGFRHIVVADLKNNLHKGEVVYGEVVGWTEGGAPIMSPQSTKDMKELRKEYGDEMVYKYAQPKGTCQFYIYRITRVNEEGVVTELTWPQVRQRAHELGHPHVPDMAGPYVFKDEGDARHKLLELAEALSEGADPIDPSHIREGVVVRVEQPDGEVKFLKFKSFDFGRLEGYLKDTSDVVDREEIS